MEDAKNIPEFIIKTNLIFDLIHKRMYHAGPKKVLNNS